MGQPEDDADITAVVSAKSADFIEGLVDDALSKGAVAMTGSWRREENLIWPTLVDRVTDDMRLCWEEPFGPVVPVVRVTDEIEALRYVNESKYGLQGCVFTRDVDRAIRFGDAMETGTVQINGPPARGPDHFPFQGFKDSGIGSQGVRNSIECMTKTKSTVINLSAAFVRDGRVVLVLSSRRRRRNRRPSSVILSVPIPSRDLYNDTLQSSHSAAYDTRTRTRPPHFFMPSRLPERLPDPEERRVSQVWPKRIRHDARHRQPATAPPSPSTSSRRRAACAPRTRSRSS